MSEEIGRMHACSSCNVGIGCVCGMCLVLCDSLCVFSRGIMVW